MTERIRIKPAGANLVRNPDNGNRHLQSDGETLVITPYWRRRIADGDVVVEKQTPAMPAKERK
jgi:hypothetical protein